MMKQRGTMEESRWRKMLVFFILLLQFTVSSAATLRFHDLFITVRAGDDVTLSTEKQLDPDFTNCETTSWYYSLGSKSEYLLQRGQVKNTRSNRLRFTTDCSLLLTKVTAEDVGRYHWTYKYINSISVIEAYIYLSVVDLTEHQNQNTVTLNCSVVTVECKHRVKWVFDGNYVTKASQDRQESSSSCSAAVTFQTSHYIYASRFNLFSCEVKEKNGKVNLFAFNSHPSAQNETTESTFANCENPVKPEHASDWWRFLAGSVGLVALIAAVIIILTRTEGRKTHGGKKLDGNDGDDDAVNHENIRASPVCFSCHF